MSFTNQSTKQILNSTIADVATNATAISNLSSSKQDVIDSSTDLTVQNLQASSLSYDDSGSYKNVKTEIDSLTAKLNSTTSILTSSLESPDQEYNLDTLLERVITNKIKLETFVDELNGAVGDSNSGVVSLMEQVAANKASIAAEITNRGNAVSSLSDTVTANYNTQQSDNTARADAIALINSTNTHQYIVSAEGGTPVFSDGVVPYEANFGLCVIKSGSLQAIHYLAKTPDNSLTAGHSMTLTFEVWSNAGVLLTSNDVAFTNNFQKTTLGSAINLPDECNIVVKYKSSVGTYHADSRFRLALMVLH